MKEDTGFQLNKTCNSTQARTGVIFTLHGQVRTPIFCPVGSQATVKTLTPEELISSKVEMILSNTYHLYLRPGIDVVKGMGGLHHFMSWDRPILTDSGGYQVFSLAHLCKVSDEGALFHSHLDGSEHFITPELAMKYEEDLGADIIMAFDECPPHDSKMMRVQQAMERTHQWAERCIKAHAENRQALYGIVQGGMFPQLRRQSAQFISSLDFDGYAIGGLSLGEPKGITFDITEETAQLLPVDKPRYLMGVGSPEDILECVARGIDIFDSALPTRVARNGAVFTRAGRYNITNACFEKADYAIEDSCDCYTCRNFSVAYLHHLFRSKELLAYRLSTIHNLRFMMRLIDDIRLSIEEERFSDFRTDFLNNYETTDEKVRLYQKNKWLQKRRITIE